MLVSGRRVAFGQSSQLAFTMTLSGILIGIVPSVLVGMAFHGGIGACSFFGFGPLCGVLLGYVGSRIAERREEARQRALREAAKRAASTLPWASDEGEGRVRIRGRIRVLRSVTDPLLKTPVAAATDYRGERVCGRFEVVGDGVVGVVDDDLIELWDDWGWTVRLNDGDEVEVAGEAKRGPLDDGEEGYRDTAMGMIFDGRPGQPVHVFLVRPSGF